MTKSKGNGVNKGNGELSIEESEWLSRSHNKRFVKMFGADLSEEVMSEDLADKLRYDEADAILKEMRKVSRYLKRGNTILRRRAGIEVEKDK
jgi:hypothetical protein